MSAVRMFHLGMMKNKGALMLSVIQDFSEKGSWWTDEQVLLKKKKKNHAVYVLKMGF